MAIIDIKTIKDNQNSNVVMGDNNVTAFSQQLSQVRETNITSDANDWKDVVEEITALQKIVHEIPDEHEKVRDQQLVPTLSKAKTEAAKLQTSPNGEKSHFISSFKAFLDLANPVIDLGSKIAPYVITIAKLMGVSLS